MKVLLEATLAALLTRQALPSRTPVPVMVAIFVVIIVADVFEIRVHLV